ncbi:THBS2S [Mytilus coruscus]|uniref:THBS2S n=1 Tax=Mytilus coruscus TaxID=42192 RepID=A0A6J8E455_MYTCO|nr:THBS2S [Mytilus coruscus]
MKNLSGLCLLVLAFTVSEVYGHCQTCSRRVRHKIGRFYSYTTKKYLCRCSVDGGWSDFGEESRPRRLKECPIDGGWSEYGNFNEWSACSVTCGKGTKSHERTRSCTKPEPQFGGNDCEGSEVDIQTDSCEMLDCPEVECTSDGLFAYPKDCTKFIQCDNKFKYATVTMVTTVNSEN